MVQFNFNTKINVKSKGYGEVRRNANVPYGDFAKFANVSGVYFIRCNITNKEYIGSSKNIQLRITKHFNELFNHIHSNKSLQKDFDEYGYNEFVFDVYEICKDKELLIKEREKQIFIGIENLYNDKISNYYVSEELKNKYANVSKDTHKTIQYREKMSKLKSNYIMQYEIDVVNQRYNPIKMYNNMEEVLDNNPTFKGQPIRGVCNGSKKSAYGFYWRYVDKEGNLLDTGRKKCSE